MAEKCPQKETQLTPEQLLKAGDRFLQHFGVEVSPTEQPEQFLEAMAQLDPRYQGGRELVRWQLEADQTEFDDETKQVILDTAEAMRMLEAETPLIGHFDVVIVLGGARQANLDRARYTAEAIAKAEAAVDHVVIVGSKRKLNEAEKENTANYALGAQTEFDLCVGAERTIGEEYRGFVFDVMSDDSERAGTPAVIETALFNLQADGRLKSGGRSLPKFIKLLLNLIWLVLLKSLA
jgi:hypothetical protein